MIKRIIELTHGSYVHLHHHQLVIEQDGQCVASAPAEDVGLLLLAHPANVITQQALACCQQYGVAIAVCDEHHLPSALMLPLDGHSLHAEILRQQVAASPAAQAALWQAVIRGKISAQAEVLAKLGRPGEARLRRLADDPGLARRLVEGARARTRRFFSWDVVVPALKQVYEKVARKA